MRSRMPTWFLDPYRPLKSALWWSCVFLLLLDCSAQEDLRLDGLRTTDSKSYQGERLHRVKHRHSRRHQTQDHSPAFTNPLVESLNLRDSSGIDEDSLGSQVTQFEYPRHLVPRGNNPSSLPQSGSWKKRKRGNGRGHVDGGRQNPFKARKKSSASTGDFSGGPFSRSNSHSGRRKASKPQSLPQHQKLRQSPPPKAKRSNIILIITDDLDVELGSLNYMPRLLRLMGGQGALFPNSYTSTPMCCPSRSSMLTGMYIHNHEIYTNHKNCSGPHWQKTHERRNFAAYLKNSGYKTGYFGKYLNRYNGSHVPPGWQEWAGLVANSRYYNYTVNRNSHLVKYGNKYPQDYFPHVITTDGINFLRESQKDGDDAPFLMVLSYPAPHGPEDSAPEHAHKYFNASDHHTASYNYAPNPDKQWMLQITDRMPDIQLKFTDLLMTKRLQTLQSVDEAIEKIIKEVDYLGLRDDTYLFFTSDHGYHLGQFGLAKGKSMPFEFDIKVPLLVRGPGIKAGSVLSSIALNIDLAPTFLDIAGLPRPPQMDGRSLLPVFKSSSLDEADRSVQWRDSFLVESSGRHREEELFEKKEQRTWERERAITKQLIEATASSLNSSGDGMGLSVNLYTSKHERFEEVCKRVEFASPCTPTQKWHCVKNGHRWRIKKCRQRNDLWQKHCICQSPHGFGTYRKLDPRERRKQRNFLKKYLSKNLHSFDAKFIKTFNNVKLPNVDPRHFTSTPQVSFRKKNFSKRHRRSTENLQSGSSIDLQGSPLPPQTQSVSSSQPIEDSSAAFSSPSFELNLDESLTDINIQAFIEEEELRDLEDQIFEITDELQLLENASSTADPTSTHDQTVSNSQASVLHGCQANDGHIDCQEEVYKNIDTWMSSKKAIEDHIRRLRQQLALMKNIHRHLQSKRPESVESINLDLFDFEGAGYPSNESTGSSQLSQDLIEEIEDLGAVTNVKSLQPADLMNETLPEIATTSSPLETTIKEQDASGLVSASRRPLNSRTHSRRNKLRKTAYHKYGKQSTKPPQLRLFPVPMSLLLDEFSVLENDATEPLCWCDLRIAKRLQLQQERALKREERKKMREQRQNKKRNRRMRKKQKQIALCNHRSLNCYTHDNNHWKTPPLWTDGSFCFCINAANNTYWCLRTINETQNFLYCEFITGLITYYDLHIDPYQLRNVAFTLSNERVIELHAKLQRLRVCSGADDCDGFDPPPLENANQTDNQNLDHYPDKELEVQGASSDNSVLATPEGERAVLSFTKIPNFKNFYKQRKYNKLHKRDRRRKLKKEKKKRLKNRLKGARIDNSQAYLDGSYGWRQNKVRLPRKSRKDKIVAKERKRDRQRRKRKRRRKIYKD